MIIIIDGVNTIFTYISLKYVTCDVVVIVVDDEMTQNAFYIFFLFSWWHKLLLAHEDDIILCILIVTIFIEKCDLALRSGTLISYILGIYLVVL